MMGSRSAYTYNHGIHRLNGIVFDDTHSYALLVQCTWALQPFIVNHANKPSV